MKKQSVLLITFLVISIGILSGCNENNNNVSDECIFSITNLASYEIEISIDFKGEDFNFNRELIVEKGKTESTSFMMEPKEQQIEYTITASYVGYPQYYDTDEGEWSLTPSGSDWQYNFKVYGSLNPPKNQTSISIQGPL